DAYAVFSRTHFERSPVRANEWSRLRLPFNVLGGPVTLAARGKRVWLLGTPKSNAPLYHPRLARSSDRGTSFTVGVGPGFPGLGGALTPAGDGVVWATCSSGMMGVAFRSTDAGRTVSRLRTQALIHA